MPKKQTIVINTGPIITLVSAFGDLKVLKYLYDVIMVPLEVANEITIGGENGFAVKEFEEAVWLKKLNIPLNISSYLTNSLDKGEASVIQLALNQKIRTVCIDETVGRRVARLNGLMLTGSIGILIRAKKEGYLYSMKDTIDRIQTKGIWLSKNLIDFALKYANE